MKYQLNLTALSCPLPLLAAKKALQGLAERDELMLVLNRESAAENFSIFARENDVKLVQQYWQSEKEFVVILKKENLSP